MSVLNLAHVAESWPQQSALLNPQPDELVLSQATLGREILLRSIDTDTSRDYQTFSAALLLYSVTQTLIVARFTVALDSISSTPSTIPAQSDQERAPDSS